MTDDMHAKALEMAARLLKQSARLIDTMRRDASQRPSNGDEKGNLADILYVAQEYIGDTLHCLEAASALHRSHQQAIVKRAGFKVIENTP